MIINQLHVIRIATNPGKTDPPLIIHTDAVLVFMVALQLLKAVSGRHAQIVKSLSRINHLQLTHCGSLNIHRQPLSHVRGEKVVLFFHPENCGS